MADKNSKWALNKPGSFYVDDQCIACDACIREAPLFFEMNSENAHAFVKEQPSTEEERKLCQEALESCPVGAIGEDGEGN